MIPVSLKIGLGVLNILVKRAGFRVNPIAGNQEKELLKKIYPPSQTIR
jgi:hypothetical protein